MSQEIPGQVEENAPLLSKRRIVTKKKLPKVNDSLADKNIYNRIIEDSGFYPDIDDPQFISRLLKKSEFTETESTFNPNDTPCTSGPDFEITPVQRFVANFLHPRTPYMGALLYHGVGVGKTCAAIQSAEAYLDVYPTRKVFIICPEAIRSGFLRTIFDFSEDNLTIGYDNEPNSARGCTGNTYLRLTECLYERNIEVIKNKIKRAINRRYTFFGYIEFRNYIRNVIRHITGENVAERRAAALQKEFNYRLLIIDEAHNVRASTFTQKQEIEDMDDNDNNEQNAENNAKKQEKIEKKSGAKLAPFLEELLMNTEGIKLLLMTATPMFNTVFEIHFLLNLLLRNDKKPIIDINSILNEDGSIADGAENVLKPVVNAYVSFMRGENPTSFPLRLYPEGNDPNGENVMRLKSGIYPQNPLTGEPIPDEIKEKMAKLPILLSKSPEDSYYDKILKRLTSRLIVNGADANVLDSLVQASNCVFPPQTGEYSKEIADTYVGNTGFRNTFKEVVGGNSPGARESIANPDWLLEENFRKYSPKGATIVRYLKNAQGVQFVYSRFIYSGALLLALALEANGFTPYGRQPLLANGNQNPLGKLCALCPKHRKEHKGADHEFVAAKYAILSGDPKLSTTAYMADAISVARSNKNMNGELIKVVIGSEVASEGIDLKFIREIHILDAWFNFAKMEQIIGRGIRYCSHSMLPIEKRNTTIFLHSILYNDNKNEAADLYCYRKTLNKAIQVGMMSRLLKVFALDCNLRKNVTILKNIGKRIQIDSQGQTRSGPLGEILPKGEIGEGVLLDDMDFSPICDWMECKPIVCEPDVHIDLRQSDDSTYSIFSSRYREMKIKQIISQIFNTKQPWQRQEDLIQILLMRGIPRAAIDYILRDIVNNRNFKIRANGLEGYLTYKNKYFLFQPDKYSSIHIPMALRVAQYPLKRDRYTPDQITPVDVEGPLVTEDIVTLTDEDKTSSREFWAILVGWIHDLIEGRKDSVAPIERNVELFTRKNPAVKIKFMNRLEMIVYLKPKINDNAIFEKIALEYLWDEFFDSNIQVALLFDTPHAVGKEQLIQSGSIKAVRSVNPYNNKLEYMCKVNGNVQECDPGIIEVLENGDMEDSVKERVADVLHAGNPYGALVPKRGTMVFKTYEPQPIAREKSKKSQEKKGQECAIIAKRAQYVDKLVELGEHLRKNKLNDLELNKGHLDSVADIINTSARGCAILDLVLRYMDALRVGKKRWFFRSVAAYYSGHRGLVAPTHTVPVPEKPKEIKTKKIKVVREKPEIIPVPPISEKGNEEKLSKKKLAKKIVDVALINTREEDIIRENEALAKKEIEERAQIEAEERARIEAEEKAKRREEKRAKRKVEEERARIEAEERVKKEAEERARIEAEERVKKEAEERARIEAEERAKKEEEERARIEAEEMVKKEAEERARIEAEERAKKEEEERARIEAEERVKKEAEEKARRNIEERVRKEAEDKARIEAEEQERTRKETEEMAKKLPQESAIVQPPNIRPAPSAPAKKIYGRRPRGGPGVKLENTSNVI